MHTPPLLQTYFNHSDGLCGKHEPAQVISQISSIEKRLSLLTFGIVVDSAHANLERWSELANVYEHWLFDPSQVAYKTSPQIQEGLQQLHIKTPKHIARVWWQISRGVQGRSKGSWLALLESNQKDALQLQTYLSNSSTTFPVLSGPVLSIYWLDLIHRIGDVELAGWESLRLPVGNELKAEMHLFEITEEQAHPAMIRAIQLWKQVCQKGKNVTCGLEHCPNT